jgi:hypothetical protein
MKPAAVFSTACFPTVEYISALISKHEIFMERHEHFVKQTNRNRYHIYGPNGVISLHIPLIHDGLNNQSINKVSIAYDIPWQRTHWRTITAAYNRSPFFEYYQDELGSLFFNEYEYLVAFNDKMLEWLLKCLKTEISINFTSAYSPTADLVINDLRLLSNSKTNQPLVKTDFKKYPQVFEDKHGFIKNLSVLDLLFNTGPQAFSYLKSG